MTSTAPDSITHIDPSADMFVLTEASDIHYTSEMTSHVCPRDPFLTVDIVSKNTGFPFQTNGGAVNTSNPWTPATPGNADGQSDTTKLVMWSSGSIHNGVKHPYGFGFDADNPDPKFHFYGTYYLPHKALADAVDGTHFTKTMTATFATEHFGTYYLPHKALG